MRPTFRWIQPAAIAACLALHAIVVLCFLFRWDRAAIFTIVPYPVWCLVGLVMAAGIWLIVRSPAGRTLVGLWLATLLFSDELRPLLRVGAAQPTPSAEGATPTLDGEKPIRLVSWNTHLGDPAALEEILHWKPDVVFLQEAPFAPHVATFALRLHGPGVFYVQRGSCAIIAKGRAFQYFNWSLPPNLPGGQPRALAGRLTLNDGRTVDLLNVHLLSAERAAQFWKPDTWRRHALNRRTRRFQLDVVLGSFDTVRKAMPGSAQTIVGGDFNAPAGDGALRILSSRKYLDTYLEAASLPGNTFPNSFPLQRIDQIWTEASLVPVRHGAVHVQRSDHRMVVADILIHS